MSEECRSDPWADSIKDEPIQIIRSLSSTANRMRLGKCVLEGESLIEQAVSSGISLDFVLRTDESCNGLSQLVRSLGIPGFLTRTGLMKKALRTERGVNWVAVAALPEYCDREDPYGNFAVVLNNVVDPGNLGSIIRTTYALGVRDVVLTDSDTDLTSRKVLSASRGTVLHPIFREFSSAVDALLSLRSRGFELVATSPRGRMLQGEVPLTGRPVALIIGDQKDGIDKEAMDMSDYVVRIPMSSSIESLNVNASAGISIYELRLKMILAAIMADNEQSLFGILGDILKRMNTRHKILCSGHDSIGGDELSILTLTSNHDAVTSDWLSRLGFESEKINRITDSMTAKGLLSEERQITDRGLRALALNWNSIQNAEESALNGLSRYQKAQLFQTLCDIRDRI